MMTLKSCEFNSSLGKLFQLIIIFLHKSLMGCAHISPKDLILAFMFVLPNRMSMTLRPELIY